MNNCGFVLNTLYWLYGENLTEAFNELCAIEACDADQICTYKQTKMQELVEFISINSDFYRNILPPSMRIPSDCDMDYLSSVLPVIDKKTIIAEYYNIICKTGRVSKRSTSGTTGTPLTFVKDRKALGYMDAMMYCAYGWHSIFPNSRQVRLWGRAIDFKGQIIQTFKDVIFNRRRLSAFEINDKNCAVFYYTLKKFKPKYFYCYPNAIYQFALSLERQGLDGHDLDIATALCTGEVLFPHHREKIKQIFGCNVVNEYGSTENGVIGFECEYGRMHVMPTIHLEIINKDSEGFGDIVVTELNSKILPFIRYKIGDIGRLKDGSCECHRPYQLLEVREGRIDDYIICPDGRKVYDAILAYTLKKYVTQFKAFQDTSNCIKILIIPNQNFDGQSESKIRKVLQKYLGGDMLIDIIRVASIPCEASGKFKYFVSNINK